MLEKVCIKFEVDEASRRTEPLPNANLYREAGCNVSDFCEMVDVRISCDNWFAFYSVFNIEDLNRMLKTQIKNENFEHAEMIRKHIAVKIKKLNG